jgi:hypothetical protein
MLHRKLLGIIQIFQEIFLQLKIFYTFAPAKLQNLAHVAGTKMVPKAGNLISGDDIGFSGSRA